MGRGRTQHAHRAPAGAGLAVFSPGELEERGFITQSRADLTLITPGRHKRSWSDDELHLRSAVIDRDGRYVSLGFPKFFNWDEHPAHTERLVRALADGEPVCFREKLDGSLCIRSVIDGQVVLRTRGTFDGHSHASRMRHIAAHQHAHLLDPDAYPDMSLLYEYTGPSNHHVLAYDEDRLTLLGAVNHRDGRLARADQLREISQILGSPLAPEQELPSVPGELVELVRARTGSEGVVASCAGGQILVKLKSAAYLHAHALRFSLTHRRVIELCLERDITDERGLADALTEAAGGVEFELEQFARDAFGAYLRARDEVRAEHRTASAFVESHRHLERGAFARLATQRIGAGAPLCFALLDGRAERIQQWLHKMIAQRAADSLAPEDI